MPREQITIENFSAGIITTVDAQDTPINAASWSLDQDPEVPQGILRGREDDEDYIDTTDDHKGSFFSWIVREDGKRDFIFYSKTTGKVCSIADFFSAKTYASAATLTASLQVSIETINRAVRIGYGDNAVKYYGYIDNGQFGGAAPSGLQYLNSELDNPSMFPKVYKAVGTSTVSYACEWHGTKIFKITQSTGAFTLSDKTFFQIISIAWDGTYLWVYDALDGTYGIVHKLDSSMTVVTSFALSGWGTTGSAFGGGETGECTDMELNGDETSLWFAGVRTTLTSTNWASTTSKFLYRVSISGLTNGQTILPLNKTFNMTTAAMGNGRFSGGGGAAQVQLPKRSLVKLPYNTDVGVLVSCVTDVLYNTNVPDNLGFCIFICNDSFAADDALTSANSTTIKFGTISNTARVVGIYCPTVSGNSEVFLLSSYNEGKIFAYACDSTANTWFSKDTNGSAYDWGATIWITKNASATRTVGDSIYEGNPSFQKILTNKFYYHIFQGFSGEGTLTTSTSIDQTGRMIYDNIDEDGSPFNTQTYIKKSDFSLVVGTNLTTDGSLTSSKRYYYKYALVYQDSQLSPLETFNSPTSYLPASGSTNSAKVTLRLLASAINTRVTGIAVFRAESSSSQTTPTSDYRLCGQADVRIAWALSGSSFTGTFYETNFYDNGSYGPSYESESGIPETLPNNYIRYSVAAQGNGYFFVGQCYNEEFDTNSALNIIFRSKKNAPDTFDWSNDFLVLPVRPIAMHFFKNLLYVFDQNDIYVIDPESFTLLAKQSGYGVVDPRNITSNNDYMVFANANNIYLHDGQKVQIISKAINISQYSSIGGLTVSTHRGLMASYDLSVAFFEKKNSIFFCYTKSSSTTICFVFHLPTMSWYYWELTNELGTNLFTAGSGSKVCFSDYLGNIYLECIGGVARIATVSTRLTCTWISRQFNGGDVTSIKKFIRIILNLPKFGTLATKYYTTDGNTTIATVFTSGTNLADSTTKSTSIWMKILVANSEQLQGITLIFRRMFGIR